MKSSKDILAEVASTFASQWEIRDGKVVPDQDSIGLGNKGVKLEATILYADMAGSTALVDGYKDWFAAEIYKSYLLAACHVIRNNDGEITSFDGDRVMAVFIGKSKNTVAAKTAMQISFIVKEINKKLEAEYPKSTYRLQHKVGIDTSQVLAVRSGIRNANDLVWVGPSANHAAKLCDECNSVYPIAISESVYRLLAESSKLGGNPKQDMWTKHYRLDDKSVVYRSSWFWNF